MRSLERDTLLLHFGRGSGVLTLAAPRGLGRPLRLAQRSLRMTKEPDTLRSRRPQEERGGPFTNGPYKKIADR